jgi:fermentation-respiration switch protein FrsA (DUF1100 family)
VDLLNTFLFFPDRALDGTPAEAGLSYADVEFQTEDGESLHGWWISSETRPALAHVLHMHGNAGNISHRIFEARLLAAAGLDVFLFDYRGYGRSSGRPSEEGTYRDARAARQALARQEGVAAERLIYLGESLGGAVAVHEALESPPLGLVLRSTFTSVRALAKLHYPVVPRALVPDAYPSLERVARLRCPVLVVHGERDDIAPFSQGEALFAAAPEPKRFHRVPRADHNDLVVTAPDEYSRIIAGWVKALPRPPLDAGAH